MPRVASKDPLLVLFGNNLRAARERAGMSQDALASEAGIDRTQVGVLERGIQEPKILTLVKLARPMGIEPRDLMNGLG